eukprot:scaffold313112_cov26-Attheya_sp.AAC.1
MIRRRQNKCNGTEPTATKRPTDRPRYNAVPNGKRCLRLAAHGYGSQNPKDRKCTTTYTTAKVNIPNIIGTAPHRTIDCVDRSVWPTISWSLTDRIGCTDRLRRSFAAS